MTRKAFPKGKVRSYFEVRDNIENGSILLCSGEASFSKIIKKVTGSIWSHVGFVMWLESLDRLMVLESKESFGVRAVPLSSYLEYNGRVVIAENSQVHNTLSSKPEAGTALGRFSVDLLGYPYDNDEIARIAWRIITKRKKGERKEDKEYICSEFAAECFASIGAKIPYDRRGFITPGDFSEWSTLKYILK